MPGDSKEDKETKRDLHLKAAPIFAKHGDRYREGNCYADASCLMLGLGDATRAESYKMKGLQMMMESVSGMGKGGLSDAGLINIKF